MTLAEIKTWNDYNDWANDRLCSMLKTAFGEETDLRGHPNAAVRAIQETAVHMIAAQATWRTRIQGSNPKEPLEAAEYPTPLAIRFAFGAERARFGAWLAGLESDAALRREISYVNSQGTPYCEPLEEILQHLVFHAMYHRGQITARLIDTGHENAVLFIDFIVYCREFASSLPDAPAA